MDLTERIMPSLGAWILLLSVACGSVYGNVQFVISNGCPYTVWPGVLPNAGKPVLANGGLTLQPGQSSTIDAPAGWAGRFWGRTGCQFTSDGAGTCASGDCGGRLECQGVGATPPATLVEFTLQGTMGATQDYYDVSLVDGYNVPISVAPSGTASGDCGVASCAVNINSNCPSSLQVVDDGQVVSCKSACLAFQSSQYCCNGAYASPTTCAPTTYSEFFKSACPDAYSYAYDDATSTFTCSSTQYTIVFCPSSTPSIASHSTRTSSGILPVNNTGDTGILDSRAWSGCTNMMTYQTMTIPILFWLILGFLAC